MRAATAAGRVLTVYARAIEDASSRLCELRQEEWQDFGLAVLSMSLALAATQARPALALPLFLGGVAVAARGVRALWRRWDLVERLTGERDAYLIPEILARAEREATVERREAYAAWIRRELEQSALSHRDRVMLVAEEMEALACELDDDELVLDPACAVACMRLLNDASVSPLLNLALPPEELRSRVRQIRSGFEPRQAA